MKHPSLRFAFISSFGLPTEKITKKAIAGTLVALFLGIVMSFGYIFHQERRALENVRPALEISSSYVSDLLESERPLLDLAAEDRIKKNDTAIAEIEKRIDEIRRLAEAGSHRTIYYDAMKHMQLSEAVIRESSDLFRHAMLIDAADARLNGAKASLKNARNIHAANYRRKNFLDSLNDSVEELEQTERSRKGIIHLLMRMQAEQAGLEKAVGAQPLVDKSVLTKAIIRLSNTKPASGVSTR